MSFLSTKLVARMNDINYYSFTQIIVLPIGGEIGPNEIGPYKIGPSNRTYKIGPYKIGPL